MIVINTRTYVHVQADQRQIILIDDSQCVLQFFMPDTMLALLATSIGLAAVAMTKAWVDAQPHRMAGMSLPQLLQHLR